MRRPGTLSRQASKASKQTSQQPAGKQASTLASKVTNKTRTTATCVVLSYHAADHDKELLSSMSMGSEAMTLTNKQTQTQRDIRHTDRQTEKKHVSPLRSCALSVIDVAHAGEKTNKQTNKQKKQTRSKQTNKETKKQQQTNKIKCNNKNKNKPKQNKQTK
jgi:hypothetical protein